MKYTDLTKEQQQKFKDICNEQYGLTIMKCETGEPLYLDENLNMIDTQIIIDLLFLTHQN
ncbi:MAG: hypothetical protein WC554_18535 [Clostridia bacterium]